MKIVNVEKDIHIDVGKVIEKDVEKGVNSKRLEGKVLLNKEKKQAFMQVNGNFIQKESSEVFDKVQPEDVYKDADKDADKDIDVDIVAENSVKIQFNPKGYVVKGVDKGVDRRS